MMRYNRCLSLYAKGHKTIGIVDSIATLNSMQNQEYRMRHRVFWHWYSISHILFSLWDDWDKCVAVHHKKFHFQRLVKKMA